MSVIFEVPTFSFMEISPATGDFGDKTSLENCAWSDHPCLPVYALSDLRFQIFAYVDGADKETFADDPIMGAVTPDCDASGGGYEQNFTGTWTLAEEGEGDDPDLWVGNFTANLHAIFDLFPVGQCFNVILYNNAAAGYSTYGCFSQCFVKIDDVCFTAKVYYRCNENAFGFDYSNDFTNRVRLPMYLHSPTNSEEEKSYTKSNGSTKKLMHRIWKDYKVKTDYFPQGWHEKFAVATAHDEVFIEDTYAGVSNYFVRMEKVEIGWMEETTPQVNVAQASTTLRLATPRATINSNCI